MSDSILTPPLVKQILPIDQYFRQICTKTQIVLHYTAGSSVDSALSWWRANPERVATAFIVDRDGTVVQCFEDPRHWAWHLGVANLFGEQADRQSIGIELVNVGPLRVGLGDSGAKKLYWWANDKIPYSEVDSPDVIDTHEMWRGVRYHAAFTPEQVRSTNALVNQLTIEYNLQRRVMVSNSYMPHTSYARQGVLGHHNYRPDKTDVGPFFPWKMINYQGAVL